MSECCCSPLGPGPSPTPSGGNGAAAMPLDLPEGSGGLDWPLFPVAGNTPPQAIAGGAAPAIDFRTARYQLLTLSANATPTMTVPPAGVEVFLEVIQPPAGGPWVVSAWPAIVDWDVVTTGGGPPSLGTAANTVNLLRFISNGTRLRGSSHGEF